MKIHENISSEVCTYNNSKEAKILLRLNGLQMVGTLANIELG